MGTSSNVSKGIIYRRIVVHEPKTGNEGHDYDNILISMSLLNKLRTERFHGFVSALWQRYGTFLKPEILLF